MGSHRAGGMRQEGGKLCRREMERDEEKEGGGEGGGAPDEEYGKRRQTEKLIEDD